MNALIIYFLVFTFGLSIISPAQTNGNIKNKSLKEILTIGLKDSELLLSTQSVVQCDDNFLFVTDKLSYSVKKFNNKGAKVGEIGKRGRKSGEFRGPANIDYHKNFICVADFASPRVQIFTKDFKHVKTFYTAGAIFDLAFDQNGFLWIGALTGKKGKSLIKYDINNGKEIKTIPLKNTKGSNFVDDIFSFCITKKGNIAAVFSTLNKIEIWDTSGNFKYEFSVADLPSAPKKRKFSTGIFSKSVELPEGNIFFCVTADHNENIFILGGDYSLNQYRDVYVCQLNGNQVSTFTLPVKASYIKIDKDGNLLTIENKGTLIKKYSLPKIKAKTK